MKIRIICVVIFLVCIIGCNKETEAECLDGPLVFNKGVNEISVSQEINGVSIERKVFIRVPSNMDSTNDYTLFFGFHGAGGSGLNFSNNQKLIDLINSGEFIGVYPNGYSNSGSNGGFWNLGNEPTDADDIEFVTLIIDKIKEYKNVDISRMYAMGFSNGAGMVNLLGKSTDYFSGIAPLFSHQILSVGALSSKRSLSVYQLNGLEDEVVPVNGGVSSVGNFMSAEDSIKNWADLFNCNPSSLKESFKWGEVDLDQWSYKNCDDNHEVKMIWANETGHGFDDPVARDKVYEEVWSFLKEH